MIRIAMIDPATRTVVNIAEIDPAKLKDRSVRAEGAKKSDEKVIPGWRPDDGLEFMAHDTAEIGWVLTDDGEITPPDVEPAPPPTSADLIAHAADLRWRKETGGVTLGGIPVATDDRSKVMIIGARVAAQSDPEWTTVWHGADGSAYPLNAAAMVAISSAVEAHVNSTFATFAIVKSDIESGKITTTAEIDAAFD